MKLKNRLTANIIGLVALLNLNMPSLGIDNFTEKKSLEKAIVVIDYPKELEQRNSPYSNVSSPFWGWETVFKEVGGKVGYNVEGIGRIYDLSGGIWVSQFSNNINRGEVNVKAGERGSDSYWCSSPDHHFCNGYARFTWSGKDENGNYIEIEEKVYLKHTGCKGTK